MNGAIVGIVLEKMHAAVGACGFRMWANNKQVVVLVEEPVTAMYVVCRLRQRASKARLKTVLRFTKFMKRFAKPADCVAIRTPPRLLTVGNAVSQNRTAQLREASLLRLESKA